MGVPEEYRIGFEMYKYYQHFGGEKMHIIALAKESDMWHVEPGGMLIAETRAGSLKETSLSVSSCIGWYEITPEIFRDDSKFKEWKLGEMVIKHDPETQMYDREKIPRFFLRIYENNQLYLFDLYQHYDEDGVQPNILVNDYNNVFKNINKFLIDTEQALLEQLLFERI
jgi:hypothetical protein